MPSEIQNASRTSRRGFLRSALATGGATAFAGQAVTAGNPKNLPPNVPEWSKTLGDVGRARRDARDGQRPKGRIVMRLRDIGFAMAAMASAPASLADAADKAFGEYLASECVTCHQLAGRYEGIPPIVGWPTPTFIEAMREYRKRKRANPIMQTVADRLSDEEIAALAAYFGSLPIERTR